MFTIRLLLYGSYNLYRSDFPPPKEVSNFMHNTDILCYFDSYADHFGLKARIRFQHKVLHATPALDYQKTGRWDVTVMNLSSGEVFQESFNAVMVSGGHNVFPEIPYFAGQEDFHGRIVHSHSVKTCDMFKGRRVAVVGIGNSAADVAVDATEMAAEVFLSTRGGNWIIGRWNSEGRPRDVLDITRFKHTLRRLIPALLRDRIDERTLQKHFDHDLYGLKPNHPFRAVIPTVNDALPTKIIDGSIRVKRDVNTFTKEGILFNGDEKVTPLDDVVLATGYKIKFPFLPADVVPVSDSGVKLYKHVFPPDLPHPTLAVIGLAKTSGPDFPIIELQARWIAQLLAGNCKLPPAAKMHEDIRQKLITARKRYLVSPRYSLRNDWIDYMDELADQFGAKPKVLKYLFTDNKLLRAMLFGPCVPYQFRIEGPHPWLGARETIFGVGHRVKYAIPKERSVSRSEGSQFLRGMAG